MRHPISHNTPFETEILYVQVVYCRQWDRCMVKFVKLVYSITIQIEIRIQILHNIILRDLRYSTLLNNSVEFTKTIATHNQGPLNDDRCVIWRKLTRLAVILAIITTEQSWSRGLAGLTPLVLNKIADILQPAFCIREQNSVGFDWKLA